MKQQSRPPEQYLRDDIYFCVGCGKFHSAYTSEVVEIPLTELPAEIAIDVLELRNGVLRRHPPTTRSKPKGFGK